MSAHERDDFYDEQAIMLLEEEEGSFSCVPRVIEVRSGSVSREKRVITYVLKDKSVSTGGMKGIIVNIDQDRLQKLVSANLDESSVQTMILDEQGRLISCRDEMLLGIIPDEKWVQDILTSKKDKGVFEYKDGESDFFISYQNAQLLGWYFVGMADYQGILQGFVRLRAILIIVYLALLATGLIVSAAFINRIYSPIHLLTNKVTERSGEAQSKNRNELLLQLLQGELSEEDRESLLQKFDINLNLPYCYVLRIMIDDFGKFSERYSANDIRIMKFAIQNMLEEVFRNYSRLVYCVADDMDALNVIVQLSDINEENDESQIISDVLSQIKPFLKDMSLTVGKGRCINGLKDIHKSWTEAKIASSYRLLRGKGQIIYFEDFMWEQDVDFQFHIEENNRGKSNNICTDI